MRIFVKAKTGAQEEKVVPPKLSLWVEEKEKSYYIVSVKERPVQGKANEAVRKALAGYFNIPKSNVWLISGEISKTKVFEVRM